HRGRKPIRKRQNQFLDSRQQVLSQPFDYIAIRRQQLDLPVALDRLQRPHPGIELLFRELALEHSQTAVPQRLRQERSPWLLGRGIANERAASLAPSCRGV